MENQPQTASLRLQIITFAAVRTILNTGFRMIYAFLPVIASGAGVSVSAVQRAVAGRALIGIFAPPLGSIADSRGRRMAMLTGLSICAAGLLLAAALPSYATLVIWLIAAAVGKAIFDPAMQAFIGDRVPYAQRGFAMAITEMSWSGAFLLGMPVLAWIIERSDWRTPVAGLAVLTMLPVVVLWRLLPPDTPHPDSRVSLVASLRTIAQHPAALAGLMVAMLITAANEVINIVYGQWLEEGFGLRVAALGGTAFLIGIAELSGEGFIATLMDRVGKRRTVGLGMLLSAAACVALPFLGTQRTGAFIGLFLIFLTFEITIVGTLTLMTELAPGARATMMAGVVTAVSLGRAGGAFLGEILFVQSVLPNAIGGAVLNVLALLVLFALIKQD